MAAHRNLHQLAAALCLLLLVASEMARTSEAAGCDIFQMMPCVAASRSSGVRPSTQCCSNVATMGRGIAGARCLCSLVSQPLARSQGVVPRIALGIPQKCGIPVPRGFTCQGEKLNATTFPRRTCALWFLLHRTKFVAFLLAKHEIRDGRSCSVRCTQDCFKEHQNGWWTHTCCSF